MVHSIIATHSYMIFLASKPNWICISKIGIFKMLDHSFIFQFDLQENKQINNINVYLIDQINAFLVKNNCFVLNKLVPEQEKKLNLIKKFLV